MSYSYSEAVPLNNNEIWEKYKVDVKAHTTHTSSESHSSHGNIHPVPLPATGLSLLLLFVYLFTKRK